MEMKDSCHVCIKTFGKDIDSYHPDDGWYFEEGKVYDVYPTHLTSGEQVFKYITGLYSHPMSEDFYNEHFRQVDFEALRVLEKQGTGSVSGDAKKKDMYQAIKDTAFEVGNESTQVTYERLSDVHDYIGEHEITITWRDETPYE